MEFKDTGLPPAVEDAYAYFSERIDQQARGTGFLPNIRHALKVYEHFRLQLRGAAIMAQTGVNADLISAFLIDSARYETPPADSEGEQIKQRFGDEIYNHWRVISDRAFTPPENPGKDEAFAYFSRLDRAPRAYKTAQLAFYAARIETLLDDEDKLLSKSKDPAPDRKYVDGVISLSQNFSSAHLALERRLEKDCERMDRILTRLGHPSTRPDF